jgi:uncharacterized membrane protein YhdT
MGPTKISGLPAHILLVHLTVVLVPVAAAAVLVAAVWPAARRRLTWWIPLVALVALAVVPVTTHAGQWLEARVAITPLIRKHVHLGKQLLPWAIALFIVALIVWIIARLETRGTSALTGLPSRIVVIVLALVVAGGTVRQVYLIGESGSRAVWTGNFSQNPR